MISQKTHFGSLLSIATCPPVAQLSWPPPTIPAIAAEHNIIDPVCVVLHCLHEGVPPGVAVPNAYNRVSACRVQAVYGRVILQGIHSRPMAHLHLVSNHKRDLAKEGREEWQRYNVDWMTISCLVPFHK